MKTIRVLGLLACVLLLAGVTSARVVTVRHTLDYTDNVLNYFFYGPLNDPNLIPDHSPYFRNMWEDWRWTHDLEDYVPFDANGIQGATLSIQAWDVDVMENEVDIIYVHNGTSWELVGQLEGFNNEWFTTTFTLSENILQEVLRAGELDILIDIDYWETGNRVTIAASTLTVAYTVTGEAAEPNALVHRFWSPSLASHFFTIDESEKDWLIATWPHVWTYEGVGYSAFGDALDSSLKPVHRFWSGSLGGHFYTISEEERDWLIATWPHVWAYEGVAFYAYPDGSQPSGTYPVYRFWSPVYAHHFYTISEDEKQFLIDNYSWAWTLEGIAWYAYE